MPHLSPPTLTEGEIQTILAASSGNPRDHLIYSLALGTGLRLAELVGVGDVFAPDGTPRSRVRIRPEIAKGGRTGDIPARCPGAEAPEVVGLASASGASRPVLWTRSSARSPACGSPSAVSNSRGGSGR